jgi:Zn-dependent protease
MADRRQDSLRLFRVLGVDVYLHWSWLIVAVYQFKKGLGTYPTVMWDALLYGLLFFFVLLHEFGHVLACRKVGGTADRIILWPLGGITLFKPPQRPGAVFWSFAAGPLVNLVLFFILLVPVLVDVAEGWKTGNPTLHKFVLNVAGMNLILLLFNLLPIFPLDGGQMLRALLWYPFGRASSLRIVTVVGFVGTAGLAVLAFQTQSFWTGILTFFMFLACLAGFKQAAKMQRIDMLPRRTDCACPGCGAAPPLGTAWRCAHCGARFDFFEHAGTCPGCQRHDPDVQCIECRKDYPIDAFTRLPEQTA